jgi:nucleotide-binding universal stress UspA family protein
VLLSFRRFDSVLKTILVAIDGSDFSEQVIETIRELQLQPATKIILSHVIPPRSADLEMLAADKPHPPEEIVYRQIEKQLNSYRANLPCPSELEIVSGDPAEEILRLANIHRADLIVIGNRGLTGMKRILSGSVSSQVVADAICSVLVVKPR